MTTESLNHVLAKIQDAARRGDWKAVEDDVGVLHNDIGNEWAFGPGLEDPHPNVRRLAATLLGSYAYAFKGTHYNRLRDRMRVEDDLHVRTRCAFALVVQHDRSLSVINTIAAAAGNADDEKLAATARECWDRYVKPYLNKL